MHKTYSRRQFVQQALTLTAYLGASSALPAFANIFFNPYEEQRIKKNAKHTLNFCSPYPSHEYQFSPHMHAYLKKNIQELSKGEIYVNIIDNGQQGIGTELMAKVSRGHVEAALVSVSNLSPAAPALDILNIPFWSASNQDYLNLVTSRTWKNLVTEHISAQGKIDILFHYITGPRTLTSTKLHNKIIKTPQDIQKLIFRVPSSNVLKNFYNLAGNNPINVNWKNVANLAKNGRIQALDPGIIGLYNGPNGLRDHLSVISQIESVHDGWVAVVSQQWLNSIPKRLKLIVQQAAELTFVEHLKVMPEITEHCITGLKSRGCQFYQPTNDEKQQWVDLCGHQRPEWAATKKRLLGSEKGFEQLLEATQTGNGFKLG